MITWPRDEENRYRLYLRQVEELSVLAAGPSLQAIGCAFGQLLKDGEISATDRVGVLDTFASEDETGEWIVNPYA